MPIGIGGVTVKTFDPKVSFLIKTNDYPPLFYGFNKISLFHLKDSTAFDFVVSDTSGTIYGNLAHNSNEKFPNISSIKIPQNLNMIRLTGSLTDSTQDNATIFGINLENDSSGVLYHSLGGNGAEAYHFVRAKYFAEQTKALNPQLLIISLGTNETQHRPFIKEAIEAKLDSLVQLLKTSNPGIPILLTTPPDSYFHKKNYNTALPQMHNLIVDYAAKNKIPVWDLYAVLGGYKSCFQLKKAKLLRPDGVHFNRAGYELQANLLYEALIKAYNDYVSIRPK
jgi:lysophospholipase L1-like esterase